VRRIQTLQNDGKCFYTQLQFLPAYSSVMQSYNVVANSKK
jgi:hypothetical protein